MIKNVILALMLMPFFIFSQNKKEQKKAIKAAQNWVMQIDNGKYLDSWDSAGAYFQNQIQKDRWSAALTASRLPLGKLITRELDSFDYQTESPGVPDGKYYVFTFNVSYENKNTAIETVSLFKDATGSWKVVGFFIK